jgi:Xaa-Pro aminopeptidase
MHKNRADALIEKLKQYDIDALLVTKTENIFYLTSFFSDKIALIISPSKSFLVTDFLYAEAASKFFTDLEIFVAKSKDTFSKIIAEGVNEYRIKRLGFESSSLSFSGYKKIKQALKEKGFIATEDIIESIREIKEKGEIISLKNVLRISAESFKNVKKQLRPNVTELAISKYIKETFIRNGADGYSFEPIVATQPSASQPHYTPTAKKLGNNKAVLVDMGAKLEGYNSDLTRMCPLGKISSKFMQLYTILCDAQKRAISRIKPGVKIADIDFAARQHLENKGLGKFFGHALGHGIGLEIHEKPSIAINNKDFLREGMVFTVEPGIYIPNYGGLRIEDTVLVSKGGCKVLTYDIDKSI